MKKYLIASLSCLTLLTACSSQQETTSETTGVPETTTTTATTMSAEEFQALLKSEPTTFPQLSTELAENEAAVKIQTSQGDITVKLFPERAPLAVENFLTHAKDGYYDGIIFHRVINEFMIQTGDPEGNGTGGQSIWYGKDETIDSGNGFRNEATPYLYHIRGALSMANAGPNTNGSQFFIVQNDKDWSQRLDPTSFPEAIIESYKSGGYPSLDGGYTVFGQVIEGMDVVDKIAAVETNPQDKPLEDVTIKGMEVIKDYKFK